MTEKERENLKRDIVYLLDKLSDRDLQTLHWFERRLWANKMPADCSRVSEQ